MHSVIFTKQNLRLYSERILYFGLCKTLEISLVTTHFATTFDLHVVAQMEIAERDIHRYRICERYTHFDITFITSH